MERFTRTQLWQTSLAAREKDEFAREREELRSAFLRLRERVALLVAEMPREMRDFTVHDVTHLDALWEMADLIAGSNYPVTPPEGFVLGAAFLLHDAGMGLAAYPNGLAELQRDPRWRDTAALLLRDRLERAPAAADIEPQRLQQEHPNISERATVEVLRHRHAERAEKLLFQTWTVPGSKTYQLLDDSELVSIYGALAGRIALSHWWPIEVVRREFEAERGAPGRYPGEWSVDPLKLACLLRAADASHLDDRRAPGFLQALRSPRPGSQEHWEFQNKLLQPRLVSSDRLEYTSSTPFGLSEALPWWLGYEALQVVERELRGIDQVLADCNRPRFAARGVARIEEPSRLAEVVQTEGWTPVDARLRVGDVVRLARTLGGEQLYGDSRLVPLRELIQNAADAVRARRLIESWPENWGEITVRLGEDETGDWIEVEDTGVGMSQAVITGPLLDFGTSFWGSLAMLDEYPGLAAKGFQAAGRYGIGFFSVFMWGERVSVTSRRCDEAQAATRVLEFDHGLDSRPVLRPARTDESLRMGGTRVRVYPKLSPYEAFGLLADGSVRGDRSRALRSLCAWLCPTMDVDLWTQEKLGSRELAVDARDWVSMDGGEFIARLWDLEQYLTNWPQDSDSWRLRARTLGGRLRLIKAAPSRHNAGEVIGRLCLDVQHEESADFTRGVVTIGGFRANIIDPTVGVLTGVPAQASRDTGTPDAELEELSAWATSQVPLIPPNITDPQRLIAHAEVVRLCGGDTQHLPVAQGAETWLTSKDIEAMAGRFDEVFLAERFLLDMERRKYAEWTLESNVLLTREGRSGLIRGGPMQMGPFPFQDAHADSLEERTWSFHKATLFGACIEALARGWGATVAEVARASSSKLTERSEERVVAIADGQAITKYPNVFRNPRRAT